MDYVQIATSVLTFLLVVVVYPLFRVVRNMRENDIKHLDERLDRLEQRLEKLEGRVFELVSRV